MSVETLKRRYLELLQRAGKAVAHNQFPDDFEYYACALELTDSNNNPLDFLLFPVMPKSISQTNNSPTNIKKTFGGIVELSTPTFNTIDINLQGDFGRQLKLLLGRGKVLVEGRAFHFGQGVSNFSNEIKTGYGCIKILEYIYRRAQEVDSNGLMNRLYFYNLALNNHYMVTAPMLTLSQNYESNNMIWAYNLNLKGVAYTQYVRSEENQKQKLKTILKKDLITRLITTTFDEVKTESTIFRERMITKLKGGTSLSGMKVSGQFYGRLV